MRTLVPLILASAALAQSTAPEPTFAAPVRLEATTPVRSKAATSWLGAGRLYPSPVLHDMNGDGRADLVIGDLRGHLTVSLRQPGDALIWAAETKLLASDGELLDFHNW